MIDRKDLIIVVLVASFLAIALYPKITATQFPINTESASEYNPWYDLDDSGNITIYDVVKICAIYGSSGTPINKTALLLELLDRVEALENQSVPLGYVGPPAYDSGWMSIAQGESLLLTHDLGTKELFVFVEGKNNVGFLHHTYYGCIEWSGGLWQGLAWYIPDNTHIVVTRQMNDNHWFEVRVMLWKIQQPPT